jgi:CHAD domain-containing protein
MEFLMVSTATAITSLTSLAGKLDDTSIHEIRKLTKQFRAQLDLQRALHGKNPEREKLHQSLRQLARLLCPQRDRCVMDAALGELADQSSGQPDLVRLLNSLRNALGSKSLTEPEIHKIQKLAAEVVAKAPGLMSSSFNDGMLDQFLYSRLSELSKLGPGLLVAQDFDALHKWRKQIKALMYQFQLKSSPSAKDLEIMDKLDQLGSSLGKVNDIHVLGDTLLQMFDGQEVAESQSQFASVMAMLDVRLREELESSRQLHYVLSTWL